MVFIQVHLYRSRRHTTPPPRPLAISFFSRPIRYRTIMSYWCGSNYVNYFSNPDVPFLGKPTGTDTENNAQALRDNMVSRKAFLSSLWRTWYNKRLSFSISLTHQSFGQSVISFLCTLRSVSGLLFVGQPIQVSK